MTGFVGANTESNDLACRGRTTDPTHPKWKFRELLEENYRLLSSFLGCNCNEINQDVSKSFILLPIQEKRCGVSKISLHIIASVNIWT